MSLHESHAIILRSRRLREADLLVSLATPHGRLTGVASSALNSKKRFPAGFPTAAYVHIQYREGVATGLVTIHEMTIVHSPLGSGALTPLQLGALGYVLELVERSWPERQESLEKFELLARYVHYLPQTQPPNNLLLCFCWQWLDLLGFLPMMDQCSRCHRVPQSTEEWIVVAMAGGITCPQCRLPGEKGIPIPAADLQIQALWRQCVASTDIVRDAMALPLWLTPMIYLWITSVLELNLKSEKWWSLLWLPRVNQGQHA